MCQFRVPKAQKTEHNSHHNNNEGDGKSMEDNSSQDEETGLLNESSLKESQNFPREDSRVSLLETSQKKESIAAFMVLTWLIWVPILFLPIYLYECACRSIGKADACSE